MMSHCAFARPKSHGRLLLVATLVLLPAPAFAYIDPNAGGLLYQMLFPLIAAIVSTYVFLKQWIVGAMRALAHKARRLFKPD